MVYLLVLTVLIIASYLLSRTDLKNQDIVSQWKSQIFDKSQYGETFLRFVITLIISAGALIKAVYSSYGMASLPVFLIKGQRSLEDERECIGSSIVTVRE